MLNLRESIDKMYKNDVIVRFNFKDKAAKLLLKFIEHWQSSPDKFITLAELKRNFRTISTEDARIIVGEFENEGLIIGKIQKAQIVYRFNNDPAQRTQFSNVDTESIIKFKKLFDEKLKRKIERARKLLKEVDEQKIPNLSTKNDKNLSALELHELTLCGGKENQCRFCLIAQDLEF